MKKSVLTLAGLFVFACVFSFDAFAEDLKLSDIISGDGSVSATGGGETTTYSGNPETGLTEEQQAAGGGITWKEYMDGLDVLNTEVESGKLTESEWESRTQALRRDFLEGEKRRALLHADSDTSEKEPDAVRVGDSFGDAAGMGNSANPLDFGIGVEVMTAGGGDVEHDRGSHHQD